MLRWMTGVLIVCGALAGLMGAGESQTNAGKPDAGKPAAQPAAHPAGEPAGKPPYATKGLVAYWNCDEGKGNILHDVTGRGNNGTIIGATFEKLEKGYALKFGEGTVYVDCGAPKDLDFGYDLTLEFWAKPSAMDGPGLRGVMGKAGYGTLAVMQNNAPQYRLNLAETENLVRTQPVQGEWHHIVFTFDGKKIIAYVNGQLSAEANSKYDLIPEGKNFYIGNAGLGAPTGGGGMPGEGHFMGCLDEIRAYNRALTAEEVAQNFEATRANYPGVEAP